jgi:hypothetical protein
MGGVVVLWYTLAIYLDREGTGEFEYVWIRVWASVHGLVWGSSRARVLCLCVCVNVGVCLSLCLSDLSVGFVLCMVRLSLSNAAAAMDGRCVLPLWYTLAICLDLNGAGKCEFKYVWIRVCAAVVWVGMGELSSCALACCVCVL